MTLRSGILVLVLASLETIGAFEIQISNSTGNSSESQLHSRDHYGYDSELEDQLTKRVYVGVGVTVGVLFIIGLFIVICLHCSACPAYKHRKKQRQGIVLDAQGRQQTVLIVSGHRPNQSPMYPQYAGHVYAQGVPQQQAFPNDPPPKYDHSQANVRY